MFSSDTEMLKQHYMQMDKYTWAKRPPLTKQTKQSQIHPGVSQPTSFSISSCPLLEPRLAWGNVCVGGWSCSLDREGVNGPQASGSAYSYACNFLSPFFPSSFPRFPPRRPPPHPSPSIGREKGG